jgi:hypothetical protein
MARRLTKLSGQERLKDVPSRERSNRAATHTDDVHVVVLDALARGEVVAYQPGVDSWNFVRAHSCSDAATADRHPALDRPCGHSTAEGDDEVGIIVAGVQTMRPEVDYLMPRRPETSDQIFLQTKPAMIRSYSHAHVILPA